jgi:hypothetical protein
MPLSEDDSAEIRRRVLESEHNTATKFVAQFGKRAPDRKTMESLLNGNPIRKSKLAMIDNCLKVPQRQFFTYRALAESLVVSDSDTDNANRILGAYRYHRPDSAGEIVSGGLYLFELAGLYRFFHFRRHDAFLEFLKRLKATQPTEPNYPFVVDGQKASPTHRGYFFCQQDRLYLIGADSTYLRTIMGHWVEALAEKYQRVLVLTRDDGGGIFAAKSFLVHETNERFSHNFSVQEVCDALSIRYPKEGIIRI